MFNQCFNGRHFLMNISVNEIIIDASETNGRGGGEGGGGIELTFLNSSKLLL